MFQSWQDQHPEAGALAALSPGVPLATMLVDLSPRDVDDAALIEMLAAWERLISWAAAAQAEVINEIMDRTPSSALDFVEDDVAGRLGVSRRAAEMKVVLATLLHRAPAVARALAGGELDVRKAQVITEGTAHLTVDEAVGIHAEVLPGAAERTAPQLRAAVRRLDLALDPRAGERRHRAERERRAVSVTPASCSMAWFTAYLPADDAMRVMTAVDAVAGPAAAGDPRGVDARRADALVQVMTRILDSGVGPGGPLPERQHRRPHLQVTASATTLVGLDDAPAVLAGFGPIPAEMARRIAAEATWRPLLTSASTGELLGRSATTYRPPPALAGTVVDRDVTCTVPGCRVPAIRCDIDHLRPFDPDRPAGEQTCLSNLHALCRRHHRLKTSGRWRADRDPETGVTAWLTSTGHVYLRDPVPIGPVLIDPVLIDPVPRDPMTSEPLLIDPVHPPPRRVRRTVPFDDDDAPRAAIPRSATPTGSAGPTAVEGRSLGDPPF